MFRTVADAAAAMAELGAGAGVDVEPEGVGVVDPDGALALADGVAVDEGVAVDDGVAVEEGVAVDDGVPVVAPPVVDGVDVDGAPLGETAAGGGAGPWAGTLATAPMEELVPLMGPDRPRGKKPPMPVGDASVAMLTTCKPEQYWSHSMRMMTAVTKVERSGRAIPDPGDLLQSFWQTIHHRTVAYSRLHCIVMQRIHEALLHNTGAH